MTTFIEYVMNGSWYDLYSDEEAGHAMSFLYNLLSWLDRDKADSLIWSPNKFSWYSGETQIDEFIYKVSEPKPSFNELLRLMIQNDPEVRNRLIQEEVGKYRFSSNT
jgi:hypothetical protein